MSSSPSPHPPLGWSSFRGSSPLGRGTLDGGSLSKFTYRHLAQLAAYGASSPLRVIAHIDLDAFYAQCEMVRLGVPEDQPLAVQQWQGLIAINYKARDFGIGRHCTVTDAKKLCPELISQHVATWREGDDNWAYRPDAAANIAKDKVSLDPYRLESRKILALIKDHLPANLQRVEKASIDEVFLDLSAHVHSILLERFPELTNPPPYDDPTEKLPMPPTTALDWHADALVDLEDKDAEIDAPDWDDVALLIGSELVRDIRAAIREKLHYTCSAGLSTNKMLSKLGSAYKKPNQQTVVRNRAVQNFLSDFKFTKIRNLGGKLGDQIVQLFKTDQIGELLAIPVEQLKSKLGDDTGVWVFNTIRGVDLSEVNPRTQIKSMLSAKSFRPYINNSDQAVKWLRIFAADIFSRLVEEGVLENKRRPKTINLHHRHGGQTRSRQAPIPQGKTLDKDTLFGLAQNLLNQVILEGRVWPCANLSLSVGGFEDGVTGNMGIGAFLLKGEEAQALKNMSRESTAESDGPRPAEKRPRIDDSKGIDRFFKKENMREEDTASGSKGATPLPKADLPGLTSDGKGKQIVSDNPRAHAGSVMSDDASTREYKCSRCDTTLEKNAEALQNHEDWHFAKDLQDEEERVSARFAQRQSASAPRPRNGPSATPSKKSGRPKKSEPGQSKLRFG